MTSTPFLDSLAVGLETPTSLPGFVMMYFQESALVTVAVLSGPGGAVSQVTGYLTSCDLDPNSGETVVGMVIGAFIQMTPRRISFSAESIAWIRPATPSETEHCAPPAEAAHGPSQVATPAPAPVG